MLIASTAYTQSLPLHDFRESGAYYFWDQDGFPWSMPLVDPETAPIEDQLIQGFHHNETSRRNFIVRLVESAEDKAFHEERLGHYGFMVIVYQMPEGKNTYLLWGHVALTMNENWYVQRLAPIPPEPQNQWQIR